MRERIGRYVLEALLGEGGMGQVYRAHDEVLHRRVALKVLRGATGPEAEVAAKRVLREARMAAALDHPNVVGLFDFGEDAGTPFIVMEYVVGRSLRAALAEGGAPVEERLKWLIDIARALAAAHRAGLVHRDIKPENVMLREDGVIKVLDFGIARRAGAPLGGAGEGAPSAMLDAALAPTQMTVDGAISGTPGYMAPELLTRGISDAAADQFAWGVLAYEVLSGRLPWPPSDAAGMMRSVLSRAPEPLSAAEIGVSEQVVAAVLRSIEKDPARRFASMDELLAALDEPSARASARAGPKPVKQGDIDPEAPTLLDVAPSALQDLTQAPSTKSPGRRLGIGIGAVILVAAAVGIAVKLRAAGPADPARPASSAASTPAPRAASIPAPRDAQRLTLDEGCEEFPSFTPDGKKVLYDGASGKDFHVYLIDVETRERKVVTQGQGWQYGAQLSPDGRQLAYLRTVGDDTMAFLAPLDGSAPERLVSGQGISPSFSPDGKALWAGDRAKAPQRFDVATLAPQRSLPAPPDMRINAVLELPDGRVAAAVAGISAPAPGVVLFPLGGGEPTWLFRGEIQPYLTLAPDGAAVLVTKLMRSGSELWMVPLDGAAPSSTGWGIAPNSGLSFSPLFDRVVWSTCRSRSDLVSLAPKGADGFRAAPIGESVRDWTDINPAWVPTTNFIVLVSDRDGEKNQLWVIDAEGASPARKIPTPGHSADLASVSPDGRLVAFASLGKGIHVVPFDGRGEARSLTSSAGDGAPSFSRDGKKIFFERRVSEGHYEVHEVPVEGGAPKRVVASGRRPAASPARDELAYIADNLTPTILDLKTGKSRPAAQGVPVGVSMAISRDGNRALVVTSGALMEVSLAERRVERRFDPQGDSIYGATYTKDGILLSRQIWGGDVWIGQGPFR